LSYMWCVGEEIIEIEFQPHAHLANNCRNNND
jgi:hypothetical protein